MADVSTKSERSWWESVSRSPALAFIGLLATAWLGVYGNQHAEEVLSDLARLGSSGPIAWGTVGFWMVAASIALATIAAQLAHSAERRRIDEARSQAEEKLGRLLSEGQAANETAVAQQLQLTERLKDDTQRISELIRTLPPDTTLPLVADFQVFALAELLNAHEQVLSSEIDWQSEAELRRMVEQAIRAVLRCVAGVAKQFDGEREGAAYHANLAIFLPREELQTFDDSARERLIARMIFSANPPQELSSGSGVLVIDTQLSASTDAELETVPTDAELHSIVFPVPHEHQRSVDVGGALRFQVLPGAPWAFSYAEEETWTAYYSREDLFKWCDEKGAYSHESKTKMKEYFYNHSGGRLVRSFACVAVKQHDDEGRPVPIGVLNLHCTREGMFATRLPALHLLPLLKPFNAILAALLDLRDALSDSRAFLA